MRSRFLIIISIIIVIILASSSVLATNDVPIKGVNNPLETEDAPSGESDLMSMVITAIFYLVAFILVLFLTFYGTKLFAKYSRNIRKGSNIKVLEHFNLGNNNKILVIKIYSKTYILSMNNNNTTVIDTFDSDVSNVNNENQSNKMEFQEHLESVLSDDVSNSNKNLNSKLLNMKMKVMQLKNKQHEEMDIKEEEYEDKY